MKILDCTLRDGGYYTNWDFDKDLVKTYCKSMESLPIDYVEIGYRSIPLEGYLGEYFYCPEFVMKELKEYLEQQQSEFEPNSVAGNAIAYILNRWTELSQFLRHAYAPIDTNIVEQALKLVIGLRKSSMFYKSLSSAAFASYVQSALYSAAQNNINPCEYMVALIKNTQAVIANPHAWMPWKYEDTLKQS